MKRSEIPELLHGTVLLVAMVGCTAPQREAQLASALQSSKRTGSTAAFVIEQCCTDGYTRAVNVSRIRELDSICIPLANAYDNLRIVHNRSFRRLREAELGGESTAAGESTATEVDRTTLTLARALEPFERGCP